MFGIFLISMICITIICLIIYFCNWKSKKVLIPIFIISFLCEFFVLMFIPLPVYFFDDVKIEATKTKNELSDSSEVFINHIEINNTKIKFPEVEEGRWLWQSEMYGWRSEESKSRPYDLTRAIKLKIPVGHNRNISFMGSEWAGIAKVSSGDFEGEIDCYSAEVKELDFSIPDSSKNKMISNEILQILTAVIFNVAFAALFYVIYKSRLLEAVYRRMCAFSYELVFLLFSVFMIIRWGYYPRVNSYLAGYSSAFYLKSNEFGFTKRGLIGSIFLSLSPYLTQENLAKAKLIFLALFYLAIGILIGKFVRKQKSEITRWFFIFLIIALPSTYTYVYDDVRLDTYFTFVFLISTLVITTDSFLWMLPIAVSNMILINETTCVTYLPAVFSMLIYKYIRSDNKKDKLRYLTTTLLTSVFSIPLCLYFLFGSRQQSLWYSQNIQKMLEHIREHCDFSFNLNALGAEASSLKQTGTVSFNSLNNSFSVTFLFLLSLIPAFYIFVRLWKHIISQLEENSPAEKKALLLLALSPLSTIAYMVIAYDYGRYISFMFTAIFCTLIFVAESENLQFDYNRLCSGFPNAYGKNHINVMPIVIIMFYLANGMFGAAPWVSGSAVRFNDFLLSFL